MKDCGACRKFIWSCDKEPCVRCKDQDKHETWKEYATRLEGILREEGCDSCVYVDKKQEEYPCKDCNDQGYWTLRG